MNGSQTETVFRRYSLPPLLRLGVGEGAVGYRDVVADVRQLDGCSVALRVDRGPSVHLQPARCGGVAEEGECQLTILRGVLRPGDHHAAVVARQDLGLAIEVGRTRQQGT